MKIKTRISFACTLLVAALWFTLPRLASAAPGRSTQGYLGVDIRDITDDQIAPLKLKDVRGAEIVSIDHDGPACKAGLQIHDVILQMNGAVIDGEEQLRRLLRETPPGRLVTFIVSRDGQQRTVTTQLSTREEVERQAVRDRYIVPEPPDSSSSSAYIHGGNGFFKSSPSTATGALKGTHSLLGSTLIVNSSYTGAKLEVMGPQLAEFFGAQGSAGLLVRSVDPNSPAAAAGLKAGDVVVKVNSVPVSSGTDWVKTIHENRGKPVNVLVIRDKKEQTLTMTPDDKKRSSVERGIGLEEFFGFGDDAEQTRASLAQLEPMFNQMAEQLEQGIQRVRFSPEMQQMISRVQGFATDPEFQKQ
ncbi:MAG TPA: PDZ domain-containing protein, partial [Edaphobacter sp.]